MTEADEKKAAGVASITRNLNKMAYENKLRDRFAMAALTGLLTLSYSDTINGKVTSVNDYVRISYEVADAMLKERDKKL